MKTVEFKGILYQVEDWVRFITLDRDDSSVWGWEKRPYEDEGCWGCNVGSRMFLGNDNSNQTFKEL